MNTLSESLSPLKSYKQFILYKLVPTKGGGNKKDKLPVNYESLNVCNAHDENNWATYDDAANKLSILGEDYGLGFVFTKHDPFFFLDIDNCFVDNKWSDLANNLIACFPGAAVEISQSGKGLHIIGSYQGIVPNHSCKNAFLGIELYSKERFVALTDKSTSGRVSFDCSNLLLPVIDCYFPPPANALDEEWRSEPVEEWDGFQSDDELIIKACKCKSAEGVFSGKATFLDLWENNEDKLALTYPAINQNDPYDRSSVDAALAQHLAFWTGKNHERILKLMRKSKLVRNKWDPKVHKNYLRNTIINAVSKQTTVYSANSSRFEGKTECEAFENVFILPSNNYPIIKSAQHIFSELAKFKNMFTYGGVPVELKVNNGRNILTPITPEGFRSRIESYGKKTMSYISHDQRVVLAQRLCSTESAKALLASKAAIEHLPNIRALLDCAVLSSELNVLGKGYHQENGGLLITKGEQPIDVDITSAVSYLLSLLQDFKFSTANDYARAVGMMITPALKMGGFIKSPCPADVSEADESQSGKTFRHKLNAAIYNDAPIVVALKKGGVGSVDESIGSALATGRPFILLDNFRGFFDSTFLEAAITSPESVPVRLLRKNEQFIDARSVTFQLSSNGVNTTKDMANRSCMVRIRKKQNKQWYSWPEGNLITHVQKYQAYYLGCIFSVIKEWVKQGCQKTDTTDHDMIEWAQSVDWIVQHIFKLAPLLDGHKSVQQEISEPNLVWLRAVCIAIENSQQLRVELQANDIAELCEEVDIPWPSKRTLPDRQAEQKYVGTIMSKLFKKLGVDCITIDNYLVQRDIKQVYDQLRQGYRDRKVYTINRRSP